MPLPSAVQCSNAASVVDAPVEGSVEIAFTLGADSFPITVWVMRAGPADLFEQTAIDTACATRPDADALEAGVMVVAFRQRIETEDLSWNVAPDDFSKSFRCPPPPKGYTIWPPLTGQPKEYPTGVTGWVKLAYTLKDDGRPETVWVIAAEPAGHFEWPAMRFLCMTNSGLGAPETKSALGDFFERTMSFGDEP